jgi:hypothetical protein
MNSKWVGMAIVLSGVAAACGGGRAIFDVDVFSFLAGSVKDTVPYLAPPFTPSFAATSAAQKVTLVPGLSSSSIDTVKVSGSADVLNQSGGPGTMTFQVYLASDSAGTYTAGRDSMFSPAPSVSIAAGVSRQSLPFAAPNLSPTGNALFTKSAIWVRMAAKISNPGAVLMQGKAVLTALDLRVVVQDKIF